MASFFEILFLMIIFVLLSAVIDVWKYELKMFTIHLKEWLGLMKSRVACVIQRVIQRRLAGVPAAGWLHGHAVPLAIMPPLIPPPLQLALCDHRAWTRKGSNHHYDQARCISCGALLFKIPRYD